MRLLLKRFAAVLTAVLILFSFSLTLVPVSAAEDVLSLSVTYPGLSDSSSHSFTVIFNDLSIQDTFNGNLIKKSDDPIYKAAESFLSTTPLYQGYIPFASANYYSDKFIYFINPDLDYTLTLKNNIPFSPSLSRQVYTLYVQSNGSVRWYNSTQNLWVQNLANFFPYSDFFYRGAEAPDPSSDRILYGVNVNINDKEGFIQWLKNEGKISLINSPGYNFTEKQIDLIVDVFDKYGNSPVMFMASLMKTFNIITSMRAASALIQTIQQLYSDYQNYLHSVKLEEIKPSGAANPHWRTDKDNTTLVTDQDDDTSLISILREILRTLIYLPDNIAANLSYLQNYMNDFLYDFQRQIYLLDNLPGDTESSFRTDIDAILNAIKNQSGGGSGDISVDVTISDDRQKEIDDFFSDWNLQYSDKINEKIPVLNQLSELFNDEFFEKCGIDVNEDGEVYEYYRPELAAFSAEPVPDKNQQLLNDFVGQFDDADPDFLNNVSFTSDVPDFSISMNGVKHSIFNFNLYAKYRAAIHSIIIFVTYTLYFLSLYKSLPGIIGNVSDVAHVFSDRG